MTTNIRSGIYAARYAGLAYEARGTFVLRNGSFFGIGQVGAVYEGVYRLDHKTGLVSFEGCVRFPPNTQLVNGPNVGPDGLTVPFHASAPPALPSTDFVLQIEKTPVSVHFEYVSPIPG